MILSFNKIFIFFTLLLLVGFCSCKESSIIGLDVQPEGDKVNVVFNDTSLIRSYTVKEDTARCDELPLNLLGSYVDPVFGLAQASFFTQVLPKTTAPDFGASPVADSIVLQLAYIPSFYGKKDMQTVNVFEVTQSFYLDTSYFSNPLFSTNPSSLGTVTFIPDNTDSLTVGGKRVAPHLRIKLSNAFAQSLLSAGTNLSTNELFLSFLKGLYITPAASSQAAGEGGIFGFNLLDPLSKLSVYYSNSANDSLSYDFVINTNCARVEHYYHDYSSANSSLQAQLAGDSTSGQNIVFVQSLYGLKTKFKIPYFKNLVANQKVALNKAELVFKIDQSYLDTVGPPIELFVLWINSDGKQSITLDELISLPVFGGIKTDNEYVFNITRHMQSLLNGQPDYGFYLVAGGNAINANRVVIGGSANPLYKMKLNLTYTKLQ